MKRKLLLLGAMVAVAGLAGCGGGGNDVNPNSIPATTSVPASASADVPDFIAYLQRLVVAAADTLEPVDVSAVTPPTSDTTEPSVID